MKATTVTLFIVFTMFSVFFGCSDDGDNSNVLNPEPDTNNLPIIQVQADTFINVGETLNLQAFASDIDGDSLNFSAAAEVTWSEILDGEIPDFHMDGKSGAFYFNAVGYDTPERLFTFKVDDYNSGLDSTIFIVTVNE